MTDKNQSARIKFIAALVCGLILAWGAGTTAESEGEFMLMLKQARHELRQWNYPKADEMSLELLKLAEEEGNPLWLAKARQFRGSYCFYLGDYARTVQEMEAFSELSQGDEPGLLERARKLVEVWDGAEEARSEHFIVRYKPGKDAVLVQPALDTLERAHKALTRDLDVETDAPVLVEIYPSFEGFETNTNLSSEALENSGTIAVCKYRRLMINSPRILTRGYSYRDTLSHEFVHWLIYKKYGEGVPIWLHEGIAKYEESLWRSPKGGEMTPGQKSLLASALRLNELITFDRMHPSFAYLKTPRQGQLAFAEVTTVIGYLQKKGGWDVVFKLCEEMSKSPTSEYKNAIAKVTGKPFDAFWADWERYARSLGYQEIPGMEISAFEIRQGDEGFDEVDEEVLEEDISGGDEWKYARLGDLLRNRGHFSAAAVEYDRARDLSPNSLRILNKAGLCYYLAKDYDHSLEALDFARDLYPGFSTTYINLGRTLYAMEKYEEARQALEQALDINPFNPIPYEYLINIYRERGDEDRVKTLTDNYFIVSGA
jgi:tetratricopeptide (TPR) repeat protein